MYLRTESKFMGTVTWSQLFLIIKHRNQYINEENLLLCEVTRDRKKNDSMTIRDVVNDSRSAVMKSKRPVKKGAYTCYRPNVKIDK